MLISKQQYDYTTPFFSTEFNFFFENIIQNKEGQFPLTLALPWLAIQQDFVVLSPQSYVQFFVLPTFSPTFMQLFHIT